MLRQGETGDWVGTFEGHKGAVWGVALNRSASLAASGAADFTGKVWNAYNGELMHSFQHKHIVKSVQFDNYCERLVTGSNDKLIRVFSLQNPTAEPDVFSGHGGAIKRAIFCRNDQFIVSCADDKTIRMWDRSSGSEVQRIEFQSNPNSLELSADQHILTVTHGTSVSFFESETLKKLKEIKVPTMVSAASLHPDKHVFVCGGDNFILYKFDYITGNEIGKRILLWRDGRKVSLVSCFRIFQGPFRTCTCRQLQSGWGTVCQWVGGWYSSIVADDNWENLWTLEVYGTRPEHLKLSPRGARHLNQTTIHLI